VLVNGVLTWQQGAHCGARAGQVITRCGAGAGSAVPANH
jgi:N-acyl-D-amino-acid deacylase